MPIHYRSPIYIRVDSTAFSTVQSGARPAARAATSSTDSGLWNGSHLSAHRLRYRRGSTTSTCSPLPFCLPPSASAWPSSTAQKLRQLRALKISARGFVDQHCSRIALLTPKPPVLFCCDGYSSLVPKDLEERRRRTRSIRILGR
jgi:hypothetical protein